DADIGHLYVESNWANVEIDCGDFASALERSERCIRLAQRNSVQDQYLEGLINKGYALFSLFDIPTAVATLQSASDLSELAGDAQRQSLAISGLALCRSAMDHGADAISLGKQALAIALRRGAARAELMAQRALAETYLSANNAAEAEYHAEAGASAATSNRVRRP